MILLSCTYVYIYCYYMLICYCFIYNQLSHTHTYIFRSPQEPRFRHHFLGVAPGFCNSLDWLDRSKFVEPVEPVEPPAGSGKKSDSGTAAGCWFEVSSKNRTFPWQFYWKHDEALDFGVQYFWTNHDKSRFVAGRVYGYSGYLAIFVFVRRRQV